MLKASFVRTAGQRDRIYVVRSDGTNVSWVFASYGDVPPHDMIHLVVESAFGLRQGFWGRVDAGADPGMIMAKANRVGGPDKYAGYGADQSGLLLAEGLANCGWLGQDSSAQTVHDQIVDLCRQAYLQPPEPLSLPRTEQIRAALLNLAKEWRALYPKGAIDLFFDPLDPCRGFDRLQARENHLL
jgi:hypothetical protein